MSRQPLILSAFLMNTTSHIIGGAWRREEAQQHRFNELPHWISLVKKLEDAGFDIAFFADVVGLYGDHEGGWASHVRKGLQIPSNDPLVLISALAAVTDRIGLALTSSVIQAHPFNFARQLSTLDHLSGGRVGWNVVTNSQENAHRNFGGDGLAKHDDRYAWAEEYLEVCYKLWEGSWEDGALLQDKTAEHERGRGLHADPAKVSKINHDGDRYRVEGPHLSSPSPQRTPYLFQAGSSDRGRDVAAQHAEATFSMAPRRDIAASHAQDVKERTKKFGRRPEDLKFIQGLSFVIGSTEEEAQVKAAELDASIDDHALIAHTAGSLGVDVGHLPIDTPLDDLEHTEGAQGHLSEIKRMAPNGRVTLRDLAHFRAQSTRVVGTPEKIADELAAWQDAGIDGINIINSTIPGSYDEFIEHVLPVLRERGLARRPEEATSSSSLRASITGSDRLPESHPAAQYRGAFQHLSAAATEVPKEEFLKRFQG
ncbi:LLM class flavin-dependent oxidoreductase [Nesterenkonia flava]|uniref:LLM class flavin-dependent oxidoreductase n=1 Tax=Nesterenkonia flava TaxID=469799 RepID=A0ABU1FV77_9MICC|nr:LLM class flavin-dependent oxidoreductase [Nesterenkonia flava]MDR5712572.1 LLM class flavin-dependent oxidoreductase [Nesterenkonia flava]